MFSVRNILFAVCVAMLPIAATAATADEAYKINGGDTLHISVYGETNLDRDVVVQPDGGLAFPLVGNIDARGMSLEQLQKTIGQALRQGQYLPNVTDNEVTVALVKATGNSVSVIGQVKQAGTFAINTELDVMQALSMAGGLTPFASRSGIKVLRRDSAGKQVAIPFDYADIEDGQNLDSNILLQGGDVVVVP
jgi:polysaccharide export outer membrane protein